MDRADPKRSTTRTGPIMLVLWRWPFPPMNTSPQIEQYQRNNQPHPELLSTTCLDESRQIDLILLVLWFGPFGFMVMIASTSPLSLIEWHRCKAKPYGGLRTEKSEFSVWFSNAELTVFSLRTTVFVFSSQPYLLRTAIPNSAAPIIDSMSHSKWSEAKDCSLIKSI
jgi:hypothetical protein